MDEESFPKTEPFQHLCTASQQQRAVGVTCGLNAGRAGETQQCVLFLGEQWEKEWGMTQYDCTCFWQ